MWRSSVSRADDWPADGVDALELRGLAPDPDRAARLSTLSGR
jgi:hypothetical protein